MIFLYISISNIKNFVTIFIEKFHFIIFIRAMRIRIKKHHFSMDNIVLIKLKPNTKIKINVHFFTKYNITVNHLLIYIYS